MVNRPPCLKATKDIHLVAFFISREITLMDAAAQRGTDRG